MKNREYGLFALLYNEFISFIIITIILLSTCYFKDLSTISLSLNAITKFLFFAMIYVYAIYKKISKFTVAFLLYWLLLLISTLLSQYGVIAQAFNAYYKIAAIILYLDLGLKEYPKKTLCSLSNSLLMLNLINFYTILKYPNGWFSSSLYSNNWFFGYDNRHILMFFPAIVSSYLYKKIINKKILIREIILYITITYSVFFCFSATSVVAYSIFLLYISFQKYFNKKNYINSKYFFIVFAAIFIFIVLLRVQNIFSWFIVEILKKDLTFTGRTKIWDMINDLILKRPIIGYGIEPIDIIMRKMNGPTTHAHNTILDILYKGGILSLVPFIYMVLIVVKNLYVNSEHLISKYCSVIMLCFFVMLNFEAREDRIGFYIILLLCLNHNRIIDVIKKSI